MTQQKHKWSFFKAAGVMQVSINTGADLVNLSQLPEELWTCLSVPSFGLHFDKATYNYLDKDGDGHVRAREVISTLNWTLARVKDPDSLITGSEQLPLSIFSDTTEGASLLSSAKFILASSNNATSDSISLTDVVSRKNEIIAAPLNGDGIITAQTTAQNAEATKLLNLMLTAGFTTKDRCGQDGITNANIDEFLAAVKSRIDYLNIATNSKDFYPAQDMASIITAVESLRDKIDEFFLRTKTASFSSALVPPVAATDITLATLATLPISFESAQGALDLTSSINPAFETQVSALSSALTALGLDSKMLTEANWNKLKAAIAPLKAWQEAAVFPALASLSESDLTSILNNTNTITHLKQFIADDLARLPEISGIEELEKFIRLYANLVRFINNFVNFSDFYNPKEDEIFRAGDLYIDGRKVSLCLYIQDVAAHSTLAASSKIFLAYCDITRSQNNEKKTILAMITAGFASSIWVGRHGIFYDRDGNDWEALVTKVVEAPVSLKEAFWSPWLKISEMISSQVKKLLSSKQDAMLGAASAEVNTIGDPAAPTPLPLPTKKMDGAALASSVAAIGIAVGLIGSAIAGLISTISGLPLWKTLLGVVAVFFIVSGPAVLLAYFKLRSRDLAAVLNASSWAVNSKILMNMRLGKYFTHEAAIPKGSHINLTDPYQEKRTLRKVLLGILAIIILFIIALHLNLFSLETISACTPEIIKRLLRHFTTLDTLKCLLLLK